MQPGSATAVIDIGSNSVRLVVYAGSARFPTPIFNEKLLAGLGSGLAQTGAISSKSWARALDALHRFQALLDAMNVRRVNTVATAAVRDATNGPEFVDACRGIGLDVRVLSAREEAEMAGLGIASTVTRPYGIAADLGGGSLELVDVENLDVKAGISMPLGVLRVQAAAAAEKAARAMLRTAIRDTGLSARGRSLYLIGGSWRALARIDMLATGFPLPATHQYTMAPKRLADLRRIVEAPGAKWAKHVSATRLEMAPVAAMLLDLLSQELQPDAVVVSAFGIREGLLFSQLDERTRALDPLIEAAREAALSDRRFGEHGEVLDAWINPLFDDVADMRRLRLASCLLADVAWQASPDFRAERAVEMALHGNWACAGASDRVIIAQALASSFGKDRLLGSEMSSLASSAQLKRAAQWGLAIRLGQRLTGGLGSAFSGTSLVRQRGALELRVSEERRPLVSEIVSRRLDRLADALDLQPAVVFLP